MVHWKHSVTHPSRLEPRLQCRWYPSNRMLGGSESWSGRTADDEHVAPPTKEFKNDSSVVQPAACSLYRARLCRFYLVKSSFHTTREHGRTSRTIIQCHSCPRSSTLWFWLWILQMRVSGDPLCRQRPEHRSDTIYYGRKWVLRLFAVVLCSV